MPPASSAPIDRPLGAGFRYSTYGPSYDPGPEYWLSVGRQMAERIPGSVPQAIWIVGNYSPGGTVLTFPGHDEDLRIHFSSLDNNEAALDLFDEAGLGVWLQVEPGDAPMDRLIDIVLDRYGSHPSVLGFGVDVEWYQSDGTPEGMPVGDAESAAWVAAIRAHDPRFRLFLKHWEAGMMPAVERDGIVFIDDSQQFQSLERMAAEFAAWGQAFESAPVGFQFGYPADEPWWGELEDPPSAIGDRILEVAPNMESLFWVDFTALDVFPPEADPGATPIP